MLRIYELLEKKFLNEDEVFEIELYPDLEYEYCGMSSKYLGYYWEVVKIGDEEYDIYFK